MGKTPSSFKADNNPVETVSWNNTQDFLQQLNSVASRLQGAARLPTEAEWEYACRAGTQTAFSFGNTITPEQANFNGNYPYTGGKRGLYRKQTVAVKSLPVNPWGLYEMHGNVWEWCQDWPGDYPPGLVEDPAGDGTGSYRVLRGGSWLINGRFVRSARRGRNSPDSRRDGIGFRFCLVN